MSTFLLSNNGKVGVYGNGDRVIGNSGTEKALIMNDAKNVIVDNTVEEIHLANAMDQYTVRVDANTNQVSLLSGTDVVATFAPNAAGVKIISSSGMSVIKFNVDPTTGEGTFTADNGGLGATPTVLPTDSATALPADAIDDSQKSDNAGGSNPDPTPTPTEPTGLTVGQYEDHVKAGTLPDAYNLVDTAEALAGASYAAVTGASSITVKDSVSNLTSKANEANVATAAGMANNVVVEDSLGNLLSATLPTGGIGGKPTTLLVNEVGSTNITLTDVTLAKAAGAQAELDAFLARTDVAYARNVTKPDALTLTSYSIKDTAANIIAAADDTTLRLVLADADTTTVGDTMKGISSVALSFVDMVDAIAVEDTLSNFVAAKPTKILLETLKGAGATFTATDAPDANGAVTVDIAGLMGFNDVSGSNNAQIGFANAGVTTLNLTSSTALGTTGTLDAFKLSADNFFDFSGTVNFTASDRGDNISIESVFASVNGGAGDDTIATSANSGAVRIDGGLGADTIDLTNSVSQIDTVVLGTGITKADDFAKNVDTISAFSVTDSANNGDVIDFDGFLSDFGSATTATVASAASGISGDNDAKIILVSRGDFYSSPDKISALFKNDLGSGNEMIVITSDGTDSYVWYVADADNTASIDVNEIHLVATLKGVNEATNLSAENFA